MQHAPAAPRAQAAIDACKPGVRYRDMGDVISKQAGGHG
jgi:methionine aminopeptidase